MLSLSSAALAFAPSAVPTGTSSRVAAPTMIAGDASFFDTSAKPWTSNEISTKAGLEDLAKELNPSLGFWDPMGIANEASPELIGWFRHAEIKHGRVAMAAFVGYCVQANGVHFPWNLQAPFAGLNADIPTISFSDIAAAGGPPDQWDALPSAAKLQILFVIGGLEWFSENSVALSMDGQQHYVRGGKPGYFPKLSDKIPHTCLDLYDPFGFAKKMSPEKKEKRLLMEINNGRLAMIGIFGLLSDAKGLIVPGINGIGNPPYAGEPMAFFSSVNSDLPFVTDMLKFSLP